MSSTLVDLLKSHGLSEEQGRTLVTLQKQGRELDFVYHFTDDGRDALSRGEAFDRFLEGLKSFASEGTTSKDLAAALWDHLAPCFVGWQPDFAEGVETRHRTILLNQVDQLIDAQLGRDVPQEVRAVSRELRERFDDLTFQYEAGTWRDSRTAGEVRDELHLVASLDEKIRSVLYGTARTVDLMLVPEDLAAARQLAAVDARSEAVVSDLVVRLRTSGIEVKARSISLSEGEGPSRSDAVVDRGVGGRQLRAGVSAGYTRPRVSPSPSTDAAAYWRNVAKQAPGQATSRENSLVQPVRRGRSI
jgi:hypothetical protein